MILNKIKLNFLILTLLACLGAGCNSGPTTRDGDSTGEIITDSEAFQKEQKNQRELEELNQSIALAAFNPDQLQTTDSFLDYIVGPGDILEISVFDVDELNRRVRVSGDGFILLPLLGRIMIADMTPAMIENHLVELLAEQYLQNPQVSVFITEYRSHQIAVLGAVNKPDIYNMQQPRTVLELLSQAGGLSEEAGNSVQVQRTIFDEERGAKIKETLIIELNQLVESLDSRFHFALKNGDSILVPKAGTIFVEGAVNKPGGYPVQSEANVLKMLATAGGVKFEAAKGRIQVYRQLPGGGGEVFELSLEEIRDDQSKDIVLQDGDVIIVRDNLLKKGWAGFWRGLSGIFSFGKTI